MIRILSIETSCDETALSVIEADGGTLSPSFNILGNALSSQAELHAEFGGVFPAVAKREHGKIITELLGRVLTEANILSMGEIEPNRRNEAIEFLDREPEAKENLSFFFEKYGVPKIDLICVTVGPGLVPALWVGVSVAKALSVAWQKPIVPVNHMEGHIISILLQKNSSVEKNGVNKFEKETEKTTEIKYKIPNIKFPAIALLVSGGHTEIHLVSAWNKYKLLGSTKDDAIGEAFDKTARLLGLPYPGGPKISAWAKEARDNKEEAGAEIEEILGRKIEFPRPMLHSKDFNFSYSGLKTAVLYMVRDIGEKNMTDKIKRIIARAFENAALEVVIKKTLRAVEENIANSIIVGGGVSANRQLREVLASEANVKFPNVKVFFPEQDLSTDNSVMIAMAGYFSYLRNNKRGVDLKKIIAVGNLKIKE